jgi:hypothetical protein
MTPNQLRAKIRELRTKAAGLAGKEREAIDMEIDGLLADVAEAPPDPGLEGKTRALASEDTVHAVLDKLRDLEPKIDRILADEDAELEGEPTPVAVVIPTRRKGWAPW